MTTRKTIFNRLTTRQDAIEVPEQPRGLPKPLPPESAAALDRLDRATNYAHSAALRVGDHQWHDEVERLTATLEDLVFAQTYIAGAKGSLVHRLRTLDVSWSTIGTALGMSRQAAQQRYGR